MNSLEAEPLLHLSSRLGESPRWDHRSGQLVWVDILGGAVHSTHPDSGVTRSVPLDRPVGAIALYGVDSYALAVRDGFSLLEDATMRNHIRVVEEADLRMNDGVVDPAGRFLAGTAGMGPDSPPGTLYSREVDGSVRTVLEGVTVSNGLAWSDDGTTLYYVDSATGGVDVFQYDPGEGRLANRRRHVTIPSELGVPDGLTLDAEGCMWVAVYGGGRVCRYSPAGDLIAQVLVPAAQTTACAFGGRGLDRLFITTASQELDLGDPAHEMAGALFVAEPGCVGRHESVIPARG